MEQNESSEKSPLEALRQQINDRRMADFQTDLELISDFTAVKITLIETLQHLGVGMEAANRALKERKDYFLDLFLSQSQDENPELSAKADYREISDVPTEPGFSPLPFPHPERD